MGSAQKHSKCSPINGAISQFVEQRQMLTSLRRTKRPPSLTWASGRKLTDPTDGSGHDQATKEEQTFFPSFFSPSPPFSGGRGTDGAVDRRTWGLTHAMERRSVDVTSQEHGT
uniref:Uncharacterized protein n=1 Tax=Craspedostauros australis TaxID=1486917 RepID=A0A7R9WSM1_9STRA|mmetsp:Transcript_16631/g.46027  ORF Transcript_16631/g.46027 Transcript_16631/m.46027 type:complete len:113 (+) Transcript_16631:294-632(+)